MLKTIVLSAYHPTVAEIDLEAFKENVKTLKQHITSELLLAVVKTNAYGHGIVPISQEAVRAGADRLGVTTVEEGAMLRESGITVPIHILSSIMPRQAEDIVRYHLTASISTFDLAYALSKAAEKRKKIISVHLKIDTGLHRFGVFPREAVNFCKTCYQLPGLEWEGVFTHFSSSDEGDWKKTDQQFEVFRSTVNALKSCGYNFPILHVGGSTIAIEGKPEMRLDMLRPGIALFGYTPAPRQKDKITLKPVMKLKSEIVQVHELPPNTPVGYGGNFITKSKTKIAIVPIGHGDGYKKALVNKGEMLVKGCRAKIIGSISQDQTIIDVTEISDVTEGDEVILLGKQGHEEITARDIAGWMDSIVDEVVSSFTERIRRIYI
ncbi:MAG TPA: alanine racemase [Virgibacillus sp.]|nr:alanine racemase [Virgibacillus sp.]HLR65606.1 alanine racemase [Virgibacillus sp.]